MTDIVYEIDGLTKTFGRKTVYTNLKCRICTAMLLHTKSRIDRIIKVINSNRAMENR